MINEAKKDMSTVESMKELEILKKSFKDIYEKREQKVVIRALSAARTNEEETKGMVPKEKEMFKELVDILKKYRKIIGEKVPEKKTEKPVEKKQEPEKKEVIKEENDENKEEKSNEAPQELLKARVSKYIPQFVTSHGKFGPFEAGEEISLPREVCEVLTKKSYIEVI